MARLDDGDSFPELEPHCGSWVCTAKGGAPIYEFFTRKNAEEAFNHGWTVETAAQYLGRINRCYKTTQN